MKGVMRKRQLGKVAVESSRDMNTALPLWKIQQIPIKVQEQASRAIPIHI